MAAGGNYVLVAENRKAFVLAASQQGLQGPPGPPGTGSAGGGTYLEIKTTALASGAQTIPLVAALPGLQFYINGLLQDDHSYTATLLTLPATLFIVAGDKLKVTYFSGV